MTEGRREEAAGDNAAWKLLGELEEENAKLEAAVAAAAAEQAVPAQVKTAEQDAFLELSAKGTNAGEAWVREDARPRELRRLQRWYYGLSRHVSEELDALAKGGKGIAQSLLDVIGVESNAEHFWASVLGDKGHETINEPAFAVGFVEGAVDLWEVVEKKLAA